MKSPDNTKESTKTTLETLERLIRSNHEEVMRRLERIERRIDRLESKQEAVRRTFLDEGVYPWQSLPPHKAAQIQRVHDYIKENPTCQVIEAVRATFRPDPLGYTSILSVKSYCYRVSIETFR